MDRSRPSTGGRPDCLAQGSAGSTPTSLENVVYLRRSLRGSRRCGGGRQVASNRRKRRGREPCEIGSQHHHKLARALPHQSATCASSFDRVPRTAGGSQPPEANAAARTPPCNGERGGTLSGERSAWAWPRQLRARVAKSTTQTARLPGATLTSNSEYLLPRSGWLLDPDSGNTMGPPASVRREEFCSGLQPGKTKEPMAASQAAHRCH